MTAESKTATDPHHSGITDTSKITMRDDVGRTDLPNHAPLSGADVRAIREQSNMSQAVFARHLNVSTGYISQLERGAKPPKGPALVLLNVIRRKGIQILF